MPIERDEWQGLVTGRGEPDDPLVVEVPLRPSPAGGSGRFSLPYLTAADGGSSYRTICRRRKSLWRSTLWVRPVVSLGAPTCEVALVRIPNELAGWEFRPGAGLLPGLACASVHVDAAQESRSLDYRLLDDNRRVTLGCMRSTTGAGEPTISGCTARRTTESSTAMIMDILAWRAGLERSNTLGPGRSAAPRALSHRRR